jgi:hypothetical protein
LKIHILRSSLQNLLIPDKRRKKKKNKLITEEGKFLNQIEEFKSPNYDANSYQIKATDEYIEGEISSRSKQLAQPSRSNFVFWSMTNNLQGETIPMVYSKYFLDARNIMNNSPIINTNYSSSNNIDLGNNLRNKKEWFELQEEAEPIVINQIKKRMKKKRRCDIDSNPIWNSFCSDNLSSNPSKQKRAFRIKKEKAFLRRKELFRIFWKKVFIKLKSIIRETLFGGGKRGYQPYDWNAWISDLVVEVFVVGKPEFNPEHLSTRRGTEQSESIGTIFITLQLHWSNGYCISTSSSDDG